MVLLAQVESLAVLIFGLFVAFVLGLSFWLGRRKQSASGYFAAGGRIHWGVNGIAFAGDYLSAASFLGICGMIATAGYDGFLYSIGYLAGWVVALFVVAEPMKRLGKYTFTDALDAKFNSRRIQLMAAISTLIVSICYLIPQMVGAGVLVEPLLGLPHHIGVIMVGAIVILIVATAGMASTTYVQFLKGGLLIVFSTIVAIAVCQRGLTTEPDDPVFGHYAFRAMDARLASDDVRPADPNYTYLSSKTVDFHGKDMEFLKLQSLVPVTRGDDGAYTMPLKDHTLRFSDEITEELEVLLDPNTIETREIDGEVYEIVEQDGKKVLALMGEGRSQYIDGVNFRVHEGRLFGEIESWWYVDRQDPNRPVLQETQWRTEQEKGGGVWINGAPASPENQLLKVGNLEKICGQTATEADTGPVSALEFLSRLSDAETVFRRWKKVEFTDRGDKVTCWYPVFTTGNKVMRPGLKFPVEGSALKRIDFISLMLALFFGTAALPHILIRYYTVPSPAAARKSTIVAIAAIGFFYVLTMYLGLGAMVNGTVNPLSNNMSAPLLARTFGTFLFAVISAIAFATVLGTVSGLIVAASGAVAHDLLDRYSNLRMNETQKVMAGKLAALTVGLVAIILGIVFRGMNVSFLVGWAFAVAASANLPAILMLLFWKRTTAAGIAASIGVGIVAAVGLILVSPAMYDRYGLAPADAPIPFSNPGLVSIPLSFLTLVIVSLFTKQRSETVAEGA
jgi:cation/acetate symporter